LAQDSSSRTPLVCASNIRMAMQSLLPAQGEANGPQRACPLALVSPSQTSHDMFMAAAWRVVLEAAEAMAFVADNLVSVTVSQDRRGWQIFCTLAHEDPQIRKLTLSVSKRRLLLQCRCSRHVHLLNWRTKPWKDVNCGFRALLSFVDDDQKACMPMYERGHCPNGKECSKRHPSCIKRVYVGLQTHKADQDLGTHADAICKPITFSCCVPPGHAVSALSASGLNTAQHTAENMSYQIYLNSAKLSRMSL